ncbi:MAG: LysM peptidoglycan-binding domain-containing protein [Anaerolineales bacterium]|nr:LysM peptidoglycan-binding domain-containing protein [Anaerolineales bacterium]
MNDKKLINPEEDALAEIIKATTQEVNANPSFTTDLEKKLMNAYKPKTGFGLFSVKKIATTAGWVFGWAALAVMFIWIARTIAPQPQPAAADTPFPNVDFETATPENTTPNGEAYEWNGTTLYLNAPFPETPPEMKIYTTRDEVYATVEDVKALAAQFGMSAEIYEMAGDSGDTTDYLAVDGNQQLRVRSDRYFSYFPDYAGKVSTGVYNDNPNAEALIQEFMQTHGFNFEYRIEHSQLYGAYFALPLTSDGFALRHEHFKLNSMRFYFNKDSIEFVEASLLKYDETSTVGIISAQEAFAKLIDPVAANGPGVLMGMSSGSTEQESWRRIFPLDQTITYFGYMNSTGKSVTGGAPLITLDGYTVTGNIEGVTENMQNIFVEVTGQIHETNGFKTFEMQSWKIYDGYDEGYVGTIQREGDQVVINTLEGNKFILPDMPSDIQLPFENAYIMGVTQGNIFEWKSFDTRMSQGGGGGGGGGGQGFYKLNLTGILVPIPTLKSAQDSIGSEGTTYIVAEGDTLEKIAGDFGITVDAIMQANSFKDTLIYIGQTLVIPSTPSEQEIIGQQLEGLRGIYTVSIYRSANNAERIEYGLILNSDETTLPFMLLEGNDLDKLEKYHNRPVDIWGVIDRVDEDGRPIIKVERYEIPYPDMEIAIIQGTQENIEIDGNTAVLVTTNDGKKYIQLFPGGALMMDTDIDPTQPQLFIEGLLIPNETYAGYPAIRYFSGGFAFNPQDGSPMEYEITIDQPYIYDESENLAPEDYVPPTATVEKVELVYYIPDPRYATSELEIDQRYLQPAWLFHGHYSDGSEFEYIIQAVKDEFLLPELAPYTQPG